jgi:hypothetical protein
LRGVDAERDERQLEIPFGVANNRTSIAEMQATRRRRVPKTGALAPEKI